MLRLILSFVCFVFVTNYAFGFSGQSTVKVAVVDSGTDIQHDSLRELIWKNSKDSTENGVDEDLNGFIDDIWGWNFADNSNLIIDRQYIGLYSEKMKRFYELQAKVELKTLTDEDIAWYRLISAQADWSEFIADANFYGGFSHGTHVAGIIAKHIKNRSLTTEILNVKLLPTVRTLTLRTETETEVGESVDVVLPEEEIKDLKSQLDSIAVRNGAKTAKIAAYLSEKEVTVMNGSYGIGFPQGFKMLKRVLKNVDVGQISSLAQYYMNRLVEENAKGVDHAPEVLFVFASGNDGLNNDKFPDSPSCIKRENVISVAAINEKTGQLASFSNYGKKTAHIGAPGVGIESSAPGSSNKVHMNGTSQAAPYVAGVLTAMYDENRSLSHADARKILFGTVDKTEELKEKVVSGGAVNAKRAIYAARLTSMYSVETAIEKAFNKHSKNPYAGRELEETVEKSFDDIFELDISTVTQRPILTIIK